MISTLQRLTSFWKQFHITYARRVILINSVLLTIPSYGLAVYHMPDTFLDLIIKIDRNVFFWNNDGNGSGLRLVC